MYNEIENTALAPDDKDRDVFYARIMSLTDNELNEVFAYMVKRGYIKLERE